MGCGGRGAGTQWANAPCNQCPPRLAFIPMFFGAPGEASPDDAFPDGTNLLNRRRVEVSLDCQSVADPLFAIPGRPCYRAGLGQVSFLFPHEVAFVRPLWTGQCLLAVKSFNVM